MPIGRRPWHPRGSPARSWVRRARPPSAPRPRCRPPRGRPRDRPSRKPTGTSVVAALVRPVGDTRPSRRHPVHMPRLPIARPRVVALLLAGLLTVGTASVAAATEFPAGRTGYHSYTEMAAEVAAVAAAHPAIVSRFSIGKSYQGRPLWAVKVSDNVSVDEAEPEVMFDGTHHADEHMATEMTLRIFHWLVDGYGTDPRITSIVNS